MKNTGERLHSEIKDYWAAEHYHRYVIASQFVTGKVVLDIASGEGYGSHFLSKKALEVTGVDISAEAVQFANQNYKALNLAYKEGSASKIPLTDAAVDVVVSFETIEHHDKHQEMLKEISRVLKPGGILIISSPDKKNYSDIPGYVNPYHVKELYKNEFEELVSSFFSETIFLSQKTVYGSLIFEDTSNISTAKFRELAGSIDAIRDTTEMSEPVYNLAICSNNKIPDLSLAASFYNSQKDISLHVKQLEETVELQARMLKDVFANKSFQIGNAITAPFRVIRKLLKG